MNNTSEIVWELRCGGRVSFSVRCDEYKALLKDLKERMEKRLGEKTWQDD